MAELKDLVPFTKNLSLLYIDEDTELMMKLSDVLRKVFHTVDDSENATIGIGFLKINSYDIVVIDTSSSIMSPQLLIQNIRKIAPHQEIVLTLNSDNGKIYSELCELQLAAILRKPFKASQLVDVIHTIATKLDYQRKYLEPQIKKLSDDLLYERKRIGRFMLNEKQLQARLDEYANNLDMSKKVYELTRLPSKYALQGDLGSREQAVLYINIDHFDFINTIYGMGKANKLLRATAQQLKFFLPTNAKLYHITADEFVILLDEPSQEQEYQLAQQIQALFKESAVEFDEYNHFVVFSIGIALGEGKQLFVNAKSASKEARFYGGNNIVMYNSNSQYMREQKENLFWIGTLKKAFEDDRIVNYYQPIVSNEDGNQKHYEVLCRLIDDNNKIIDAKYFIQSAKLVGLASQVTKTVIDKAFKLFANNDYNFSINITMYDLHENYLVNFLKYKCERYNIASSRVHLEIVEDILTTTTTMVDEQVSRLKEQGYHVIIDDFSSDRSAYNRMFTLKAEYIKIDGSFIKEILTNEAYRVIVKSIVDFAKKSGIKTIAEHVESEEINNVVKELGVDFSQGYFLGKPSMNL
ncbi:MAG: GGDEF domain-containing response regulator [Campylobacterales bacterium]|nr:GGDEF domain-containing response regulator [Campylobacterales bacterium]